MVGAGGFEPPASRFRSGHSGLAELRSGNGAKGWNRTTGARIFTPPFYRLNYLGNESWKTGWESNPRPLD